MDFELKTVSFGGYDKKAVETYITEMQEDYEKQISQLKETTVKLGETVDSLRKMREVNMSESKDTVDKLKTANTDLQDELEMLRARLADFEANEADYKAKYESVSKVALDAQMRADKMVRDTNAECEKQKAEVAAELERMMNETRTQCDEEKATTEAECTRLMEETRTSCQELKERTEAECERQKSTTSYDCANQKLSMETYCENLKSTTESECEKMKTETETECETLKQKTREEVYTTRSQVKRECESISEFVSQLQLSVEKVQDAIKETKDLTDGAFGDLKTQ
ncbi:MAG: hypothetical protein IJM25_12480 [Eubacterium sp.]|nr:hypothetical protein [Eubacterium sp.]